MTLTGALETSDPVWERPYDGCDGQENGDFHYDAFTLRNAGSAAVSVDIQATWQEEDGYLHVFAEPFDPTDPEVTCVAGDDDYGGPSMSRLTGVSVAAGERIVIVASTYSEETTIPSYAIDVTTRP